MSRSEASSERAVMREYRMLVGGSFVRGKGANRVAMNPASGSSIGCFRDAEPADLDGLARVAELAAEEWRRIPAQRRAAAINQLADVVEEHAEELARLDSADTGSPITQMRKDCAIAVEQLRFYAGLWPMLSGEAPTTPDGSVDFTVRDPFGVVLRIVPFNHPLLFAAGRIGAPILAGNAVILKPSEETSLSALRLGELARDVFPAGVFNVVVGPGPTVGEALVRNPRIRRIAFTGHTSVGQRIQQVAAKEGVKAVSLELGGKNPAIVFADADLEPAVEGVIRGMNFAWQGQSCGSTSRVFVAQELAREFEQEVVARIRQVRLGDPSLDATQVGAITTRRQFEKVLGYLDIARESADCEILVGGGRAEVPECPSGLFIEPTVVRLSSDVSPLMRDEIFGPVMSVTTFGHEDEVIARANASDYGLTASIWTRDLGRALQVSHRIRCGYVWVNGSSKHILGAPFGGVKGSGLGREECLEELLSYTTIKNVNIAVPT